MTFEHGGNEAPEMRLADGSYRMGVTLTADKGLVLGYEVIQFTITNDQQGAGALAAFDAVREALLTALEPWADDDAP